MRRKKWIILGVCMLFCMINIAGCVKKESKKITIGSSVDKRKRQKKKKLRIQNVKKRKNSRKRTARNRRNREGNRHQAVMLIMTLQI